MPKRIKFMSNKANKTSTIIGQSFTPDKIKIDDDSYYLILEDKTKMYYKNNILHCDNAPAIEYPNGSKEWYQNGKLHRVNGPAREIFIEEASMSDLLNFTQPEIISNLVEDPSAFDDISFEAGKENSGKKITEWYIEGEKLEILSEELLEEYRLSNNLTEQQLKQDKDTIIINSLLEIRIKRNKEINRFQTLEIEK